MSNTQEQKHTPGPWKQGAVLRTRITEKWSGNQMDRANAVEKRMVFSNFSGLDEGRSRKKICICETEEDAEFIASAPNRLKELTALRAEVSQLREENEKEKRKSEIFLNMCKDRDAQIAKSFDYKKRTEVLEAEKIDSKEREETLVKALKGVGALLGGNIKIFSSFLKEMDNAKKFNEAALSSVQTQTKEL